MIKVYHNKPLTDEEVERLNGSGGGWDSEPRFSRYANVSCGQEAAVQEAWRLGEYELVAQVETDDLESAWMKTNHITENWSGFAEVEKLIEGEVRSSSVGDVFERGGKFFMVAGIGFEEIALG